MFRRSALEMRVLIQAPIGRDAGLLASTLNAQTIETAIAGDAPELLRMLAEGAGAAIIAEEALTPEAIQALVAWLNTQPPWSDPPFIVLTSSGIPTRQSHRKAQELRILGNLALIERPVRPDTLQSAVNAALRARMRQYEIRSRQEALVQANADLEQFAHSASHDLREPLRSIGIYSDLLSRDYAEKLDERGIEFLNLIHMGAVRMHALLDDLLSYAHASSGISEEEFEPVDSRQALDSALENLAGAISESEAKITTTGDLPIVRMRESHLSQVFQNLLGNAIKYRKEHGQVLIELSVAEADGHWVFTVADNGIGVPTAYKETIFGIFKRLHSASEHPGTGMGLAICKRVVERYRGRIWVESEPGNGAQFSFTIPRQGRGGGTTD
jgi:signal transduction histidine kinase